ncbi:ATP-binding protein [Candidatus Sumerlaeota bacterium]|nr:ATP-binding protein [Candidatus Sumerlaeota bacterium]
MITPSGNGRISDMYDMGDEFSLEIHCPGTTRILSHIRPFICSIARDMGFSDEEIAQIEISVDEACSNVLSHAYGNSLPGDYRFDFQPSYQIRIALKVAKDHLQITINDFGVGNKKGPHVGVRNLEEYAQKGHGLGTYIIKKFMDKVEISYPEDSGTQVSMVKFLSR